MLPQLETNQNILPSMRDEALFCCGVWTEIPPSLWSLKSVLDTLEATQEVPRHTRLHSRGAPRVPPQFKKSPGFPSSSRDEGPLPFFVGKESWRSCSTSTGVGLNLNLERNSRVVPPFQKTLISEPTQDTPDSPALTRWPPRVSTQNRMAGVTALWHLEIKKPIPMST